jgi:hypothetical protein
MQGRGLMPRILLALAPTIALVNVASGLWLSATPHVLILTPDSYGYLGPSLSALSGSGFSHVYGRGFVYPLVIYGSLLAFGSLSGLIYLQAACYLATLVMLIALLWLFRTTTLVTSILSFLLTALYLAYAPLAIHTQAVMPEVFWSFLAVLSTFALIVAQRIRGGVLFVVMMAVAIYANWANVLVKPQWLLAAAFLTLVWLAVLFTSRLRWKVTLLLAMATLVVTTLALPERYLIAKYDVASSALFAPKSLFCNHADIIVRASEDDSSFWAGQPADFAGDIMTRLRATVAQGPHGWLLLGLDGDMCMYGENNPEVLVRKQFTDDVPSMRAFYLSTFLRAVATEPLAYAGKIGRQMWFAMGHSMDHFDLQIEARSEDMPQRSSHPGLDHIYPPTDGSIHGIVGRFPPVVRQLLKHGPWLPALALLIAVAAIYAASWKPLFPIVVIMGVWFGESLTVAVSHSFDINRYRWIGMPLVLAALFLSAQWASGIDPLRFRRPERVARQVDVS